MEEIVALKINPGQHACRVKYIPSLPINMYKVIKPHRKYNRRLSNEYLDANRHRMQ